MRLPEDVARRAFTSMPVARMATADAAGRPHLVPTAFAVAGDRIYTAVDHKPKSTRDLKRLRNLRENPRVALLADHYADDWERLWWVRADGRAEIVGDEADAAGPIDLLVAKYARYRATRPRGPLIAVTVERWVGWAASATGAADIG